MLQRFRLLLILLACIVSPARADGPSPTVQPRPAAFDQALDLIHAFGGSGDELDRAEALIRTLAEAHPQSGYAQTLQAEALSTWALSQRGTPVEVRYEVLRLTDEAIRLDPRLAQAHVARGRAYLRASIYDEAEAAIARALAIEPGHAGALFLRADIHRRRGDVDQADGGYRKFIEAVPSASRKRNGYAWMATMYETAAEDDAGKRREYLAKAREAYEAAFALEGVNGAREYVNFAIFLNDQLADFDTAARYAEHSLALTESRLARHHLAAARYQALWASDAACGSAALRQAVQQVATSTGVDLATARGFAGFSERITQRLHELQQCVHRAKQDSLLM